MIGRFFKSFFLIYKYILFEKTVDVFLCYPRNFNRSTKGTNPYFDQIVETCEANGISYRLLEFSELNVSQPLNPNAILVDFIYWNYVIILKMITLLFPKMSKEKRSAISSAVLDIVTFRKFHVNRVITIAGMLSEFFIYINRKRGIVFDLQHGIIYEGHPGYFQNDQVASVFQSHNSHIMVWGNLYKECFKKYLSPSILEEKIHIIGYPIIREKIVLENKSRNSLVCSLQFTHDLSTKQLEQMRDMLKELLDSLKGTGYKILLKHHPRFNNAINIDDLLSQYSFVELTTRSLLELVGDTLLHITYGSTTSFEFAEYGIPTFFISDERCDMGERIFKKLYFYPLYWNQNVNEVLNRINESDLYIRDCETVKRWYQNAYAPYNNELIINLLKSDEKN